MDFNDINTEVNTYSVGDLEEGMEVYADIGEYITDRRAATITEVHEDEQCVSLALGPARMDTPYVVPIKQVHKILDEGN